MEHKIMHRSYRPTLGGRAVPKDKMINDLGDQAINYIGSFSEFNPIGLSGRGDMAVYVKKETTSSINQQKAFELQGFKLEDGLNYHGSDFNCNSSIKFSKQDLLRIANAMDDTDTLQVASVGGGWGSIDLDKFQLEVKKVTK